MRRTLVIGDIHGCYDELIKLVQLANLAPEDKIISVGDLIDRGPNSPAVYRFFRDNPQAQAIMGNHERKHIRAAKGELKLARSQKLCLQQFTIQDEDYESAIAWMAELPLFLELPEAIVVHGFLEKGLPLAEQHASVLCGTMGGSGYLQRNGMWPWYDHYRSEKPVLVGHLNYTGNSHPLVIPDKVYGLDTSCVRGYTLTGLLLPEWRFLQVIAARDYWSQLAP